MQDLLSEINIGSDENVEDFGGCDGGPNNRDSSDDPNELSHDMRERKKHNRRTTHEMERQKTCPYRNCGKVYGSDGSLNLHIKIKHNGGSKTDREKLAKTIIVAFMKGHLAHVIDKIDLNLPPGTISKAARKYGLNDQVENQVLQ